MDKHNSNPRGRQVARSRSILHIMFIITLLALFSSCASREEKAKDSLGKGSRAFYAGQYEVALGHLNDAIKNNPKLPEAYYFRGNTHFSLKELNLALADYEQAINLLPGYADAWATRGDIYFYMGDREKACENWQEASRLGKSNLRDKIRFCPEREKPDETTIN